MYSKGSWNTCKEVLEDGKVQSLLFRKRPFDEVYDFIDFSKSEIKTLNHWNGTLFSKRTIKNNPLQGFCVLSSLILLGDALMVGWSWYKCDSMNKKIMGVTERTDDKKLFRVYSTRKWWFVKLYLKFCISCKRMYWCLVIFLIINNNEL